MHSKHSTAVYLKHKYFMFHKTVKKR